MPAETIIPGIAAILILLVSSSLLVAMFVYSTTIIFDSFKGGADELVRSRLNRVEIRNATAIVMLMNDGKNVIKLVIYVFNDGVDPIFNVDACDLLIHYYSKDGSTKTTRLAYGKEWQISQIILAENHAVPFDFKRSIGPGETGVIEALFIRVDLDISKPIKVIFVSQYGSTSIRWVSLGS